MKYDRLQLFFDEKGPTKTIKPNKQDDYQFNWEGNSTDNVPVYLGIYVGIPENKLQEINNKYIQFENDIRSSIKKFQQPDEIKGKYVFKKGYMPFPKLNDDSLKFANAFLDFMLNEPEIYIHGVFPHKAQVIIQSRLQQWFYWIDQKQEGVLIDNVFYSLVKYLVIDDLNHNFRDILFDKDAKTKKILDVLRKELVDFSERNRDVKNRKIQVNFYGQIISLLKKHPAPYSMYQFDGFQYTFDQLSYGLELDLLTLNGADFGTGEHYLFPDDDAPVDEFRKIEFLHVVNTVKSESTPGVRMADILAGILAKILVKINMDIDRSRDDLDSIKKLPKEWFDFTDLALSTIKQLQKLMFTRKFQMMHGIYGDHFIVLQSYIDFMSQFTNVNEINQQEDIQNDFHRYLISNFINYFELIVENIKIRRTLGYSSTREAHETGMLKKW